MENNIKKCKVEWCNKEVHSKGFCAKHYHIWDKSHYFGGVYRLNIKDKIYIGKSDMSLKHRTRDEINALKNNIKGTVPKEVLNFFNSLCIEELEEDYLEPSLRELIIDKYVSVDYLEERFPFVVDGMSKEEIVQLAFNGYVRYLDNKMDDISNYWHSKYYKTIDIAEDKEINKHKQEDIKNGTNNLLNVNKVKNK